MLQSTSQLFTQFHDSLKDFIRWRVSDEHAAQDLLQEVFLRIHSNIGSLKDSTRVQSWVYQITRNAIIDYYRTKKPREALDETLLPSEEPDDDAAHRTLLPSIRKMVDVLPEPYREAITLTEFEGISQKQLSERLGISFSGAKSRVQRGRAMLRNMLEQCCHFEFDAYGTIIEYRKVGQCCCSIAKKD